MDEYPFVVKVGPPSDDVRHLMRPDRIRGAVYMDTQGAQAISKTELTMIAIWKIALEREEIRLEDDFFDLGGDSIGMIKVINRVREQFGLELSPRVFFKNSNLRNLCK